MDRRTVIEESHDRRKIPRFQNKSIYVTLTEIRRWTLGFCAILLLLGIGPLVESLVVNPSDLTRRTFFLVAFCLLALPLYRYSKSIKFYLANESITNLERLFEDQSLLLKTIGILGTIFSIVYLIFSV